MATALTAVTVAATPASAVPPWIITPGGQSVGTAGLTTLTVKNPTSGSTIGMECTSSEADVAMESSPAPGPRLATIPEIPFDTVNDDFGMRFNDCLMAGFISFEVEQVGDWHLNGSSFNSATGVTTGTIDDIEANVFGPGCFATVAGSVNGTYTNPNASNPNGVLAVAPDFTLTVTYVDPVDDCFQLIAVNDVAAFDGEYQVSPGQTISG